MRRSDSLANNKLETKKNFENGFSVCELRSNITPVYSTYHLRGSWFNFLKCNSIRCIHLKVVTAIHVQPTFYVSDIWALSRSVLIARVSECQELVR